MEMIGTIGTGQDWDSIRDLNAVDARRRELL
jgi:hypothetical protein